MMSNPSKTCKSNGLDPGEHGGMSYLTLEPRKGPIPITAYIGPPLRATAAKKMDWHFKIFCLDTYKYKLINMLLEFQFVRKERWFVLVVLSDSYSLICKLVSAIYSLLVVLKFQQVKLSLDVCSTLNLLDVQYSLKRWNTLFKCWA
jgi:hypothetical protein